MISAIVQKMAHERKSLGRAGLFLVVIGALLLSLVVPARPHIARAAQNALQTSTTIIDGVVQSITGDQWVVGGVTIHVTSATVITGYPVVGSVVHLIAINGADGVLTAQSIALLPTASPTPGPSSTPTATITPGGPTLTPTLTATSTETPIPVTGTVTSTPIPYVTIIIEGPVEEIDVDIVIIYGQRIKLRHDDPVRVKLKIGDWIRVHGNFGRDTDQQIVIIAIIVVIIDEPITVIVQPPAPGGGGGDDDDGDGKKKKDK